MFEAFLYLRQSCDLPAQTHPYYTRARKVGECPHSVQGKFKTGSLSRGLRDGFFDIVEF